MSRRTTAQLLVVAALVLGSVVGAGSAAMASSHDDGNRANGEELRSGEDDEEGLYPINYSFFPRNRQPGHTDGYAKHFAEGLTENIVLHHIVVSSDDFGFSNCEPGNTAAFGVDRGNNDSGTSYDESLLTSYKRYNSVESAIRITYYKEETLAGSPMNITIDDQIVAAQRGCYDNPEEKGWYRLKGRINGSSTGNTETDYAIVDLTQWIYICDCESRQEAKQTLGPPPGSDGGDGGATPTPTATPTATGGTPTPTDAGDGGGGGQATPTPTEQSRQSTASPTASPKDNQNGGDGGDGGSGSDVTATATDASDGGGGGNATPTVSGPGFGVLGVLAALALTLLARRR